MIGGWAVSCEVYPRERGGTGSPPGPIRVMFGLSPRTRGNLFDGVLPLPFSRSIPANAGEPVHPLVLAQCVKVYPRERGGTTHPDVDKLFEHGLSPRTRGNLYHKDPAEGVLGSIPANAGEPTCK